MKYNIISKFYRFTVDEKRQDKIFYRFFTVVGIYFGFYLLYAIIDFMFRILYE